jgi:hypothetical protein
LKDPLEAAAETWPGESVHRWLRVWTNAMYNTSSHRLELRAP